jgi:aerobic-type carbon monoxide dehydrogenase small subunit (CoxS/CutS family)
MPRSIALTVNGRKLQVDANPQTSLLSVLRDDLNLTGSKYGCGEGQCGACSVLIEGELVRACITQLGRVAGKSITTIEGLEKEGRLHPLQEAFLKADAMQCGYCTPGMIIAGVSLLKQHPHPTRDQIVNHMNGNICRCGTYQRVVAAIELASGKAKEAAK